jgi:UDPglucose 6-dehydrogenase
MAHDPKAVENFRNEGPEIEFADSSLEAVKWAEVVFLMTEWPEYKDLPWESMSHLQAVLDGRRSVEPSRMKNIKYWSIGKPLP